MNSFMGKQLYLPPKFHHRGAIRLRLYPSNLPGSYQEGSEARQEQTPFLRVYPVYSHRQPVY